MDRFGKPFHLNFKGSDTHNTWFGTILSILATTLLTIIVGEKMLDLVFMRGPTVLVNSRPILKKEVDDLGSMLISDYQLQIGFAVMKWEDKEKADGTIENVYSHNESLPEGAVYFNKLVEGFSWTDIGDHIPLVSCKGLFGDVEDLT